MYVSWLFPIVYQLCVVFFFSIQDIYYHLLQGYLALIVWLRPVVHVY